MGRGTTSDLHRYLFFFLEHDQHMWRFKPFVKHEFCMDLDQITMELKYSYTSHWLHCSPAIVKLAPYFSIRFESYSDDCCQDGIIWNEYIGYLKGHIVGFILKSLTTGRKVIPPVPHWGPSMRACSSILCHRPAVCFIIINSEMIKQESNQGTQIPSSNLCHGTLHRILHT